MAAIVDAEEATITASTGVTHATGKGISKSYHHIARSVAAIRLRILTEGGAPAPQSANSLIAYRQSPAVMNEGYRGGSSNLTGWRHSLMLNDAMKTPSPLKRPLHLRRPAWRPEITSAAADPRRPASTVERRRSSSRWPRPRARRRLIDGQCTSAREEGEEQHVPTTARRGIGQGQHLPRSCGAIDSVKQGISLRYRRRCPASNGRRLR